MRIRRLGTIMIPLVAVLLVAGACSKSESGSTDSEAAEPSPVAVSSAASDGMAATATVAATVKDMSITLDQTTIPAGEVTFNVTNEGPSVHELIVLKTDLAPDALPLDKSGAAVDEEASGVTPMGEVEDVPAGEMMSFTTTLEPGSYVVICNIEGHYSAGMHTALTVT